MLTRKLWERFEYIVDEQAGEKISLELKRLTWDEAEPLRVHVSTALNVVAQFSKLGEGDINAAVPKAISDVFESFPVEVVRNAFEKWVRNVDGVQVEDENGVRSVTTGADLFATIADQGLVMFVLGNLDRLSRISSKLGKASGSSSTSPSTPAGSDTSSAATSTANAAGPTPSTAPAPDAADIGSASGMTSASSAPADTATSTAPGQ